MKSSQYFVRDNQKEKSSARGFPQHLHQGDQRSPETIFITMGTGGHTGLASHACPRHCVQRKEERHHYPLCLTRNRLGDPVEGIIKVICLRRIEEFLKKKKVMQNRQGWQEPDCKLSKPGCPVVLLSHPAGHPGNTLSLDLRTEAEMLSKALCHSLLYCPSADLTFGAQICTAYSAGSQHISSKLWAFCSSMEKHFQQARLLALRSAHPERSVAWG